MGRTEDKSGVTEVFSRGLSSCLQGLQAGHSVQSSSGLMAQDSRPLGTVHTKRTALRVVGSWMPLPWSGESRISEGADSGWPTGLHVGAALV